MHRSKNFVICAVPSAPAVLMRLLRLSALIYRPFPEPIRQNNVVVEFLRLAVKAALQQWEHDDGDDDAEDS